MDKIAIGPFLLQFNYNSGNKNREKVNGCPEGISLWNTFRKFFGNRKKKLMFFLMVSYIFHESGVKTFLK